MGIILLIGIIVDIALSIILMLLMIEVFGFQKAMQKRGVNFEINLGDIISRNQLKAILTLLEKQNNDYKGHGSRIIIYGYRWQYFFFYLTRVFLACIYKQEELINKYRKTMKRDSHGELACGGYLDKFNLIEIYEFNIKKIRKNEDIGILKIQFVNAIAHEFRHRIQYLNHMDIVNEEADAEEYATDFCNNNKQKLKKILNLSHTVILGSIYHKFK